MEDVVKDNIDSILERMDVCKCEKCKLDIIALALNNLPPQYVVTERGKLFSKLNELQQQFETDIQTAIIKAALQVGEHPKH